MHVTELLTQSKILKVIFYLVWIVEAFNYKWLISIVCRFKFGSFYLATSFYLPGLYQSLP